MQIKGFNCPFWQENNPKCVPTSGLRKKKGERGPNVKLILV